MAKVYSTPGVYIEEKNAFTNSVVPVATAIPCFIGFTKIAIRNDQSLSKKLVKISSFDEFSLYFGAPPVIMYEVDVDPVAADPITITPDPATQFYLYYSLKLFFNNGGGDCYIYSSGLYLKDDDSGCNKMEKSMVEDALELLLKEPEPTLIVIPDGHTMEAASNYYDLFQIVLLHCKKMINRFAILDIHGGGKKENLIDSSTTDALLKSFKDGIGTNDLDYGAVYWPWVQASVVELNELDFRNISNLKHVQEKIKAAAAVRFSKLPEGTDDPRIEEFGKLVDSLGKDDAGADTNDSAVISRQHNAMLQISAQYKAIMTRLQETANVLPPCGAMAGAYKAVDSSVGTHQAPANISLSSVIKPMVNIGHDDQEGLNIPLDGKAINAIRTFPGLGVMVWGARTMDGNSQDWRYISVRRTVSMIELSIKNATESFVFAPNDSNTWSMLKEMISNFLTNMWQTGALAGATPEDAFSVDVGLGSTMTAVDILEGYMRISVKIAVTRPAEFIVITFEQKMPTS